MSELSIRLVRLMTTGEAVTVVVGNDDRSDAAWYARALVGKSYYFGRGDTQEDALASMCTTFERWRHEGDPRVT